jgi:nitrogen-specific signal transduction histidine kinase
MLGYSDLLLSTRLTPEQQPLAAKIGLYVRRTKSQVASLISFARQSSSPKSPLDINTLARTALKLTQAQWESAEIEIRADFDNNLPRVLGDSNQLLHVCLQLVTSCLHAESERGGRSLSIRSFQYLENCILEFTTEANRSPENGESHPSCGTYEESLGLSACRGILHEHHGVVSCEQRKDGAVVLRVELPAIPAAVPSKAATVPVLWRSQPSA